MDGETVVERAARVLWEHDHPNNPWLTDEDYRAYYGSLVRGSRPTYLARAMVLEAHGLLVTERES